MNAEIITIGDEILIGQVIDTNSAFIAQVINEIGIEVCRITSISDNISEIKSALAEASHRAKLVLLTGGLGPTPDDRTKIAIKEYFNSEFRIDEGVLIHIKELLSRRGVQMNERNVEQAKVPDNCRLINNRLGTAPGLWFDRDDTTFIFMPGVPFEMKAIIGDLLPDLKELYGSPSIVYRTILTHGLPESALAKAINDWELNLPEFLSLAYLPSPGMVRLRITGKNTLEKNIYNFINDEIIKLKKIIPEYIFGYDHDLLEMVIGNILLEKNAFLATAESCTGGTIASLVTSVPGCSRYYKGSVVAYSNEIKTNVLNVDNQLIVKYGAVSREVAEAMASGVCKLLNSDYSIATTGIAGPDGGSLQKPIGTVWITVAGPDEIRSQLFRFGDERNRNITRTAYSALNQLRKMLLATEAK
jgi:nicotinamide-nucleotide amidase